MGGGALDSTGQRRPVSLLAACLAVAIAAGGLALAQQHVDRMAQTYAHVLAPSKTPVKTMDLTLQAAALQQPDLLPVYGTSELYCCGLPYNAPRFFYTEPTGFEAFAVGLPITADLFFAETFGALGGRLHGRMIVISDSAWFSSPRGIAQTAYDHTFSREIARVFTFDSPLSWHLRGAIAARMLDYPTSLRGMAVTRTALEDMASGGLRSRAGYLALTPIGRVLAWTSELRDTWATYREIQSLRTSHISPVVRPTPGSVDWTSVATAATHLAASQSTNNPFGIANYDFAHCTDIQPAGQCVPAMSLYRSGKNNAAGQIYPYPAAWVQGTMQSPEWTDLKLALEAADQLGAQTLLWMIPQQGAYADYTPLSAPARQVMYQRFAEIATQAGVQWTVFPGHDADPLFVPTYGHFSPRGWVFADEALNLFWHHQPQSVLNQDLAALGRAVPP